MATGDWRNAVDSHHLPEGTHSLAPRPGSLGRLTFQNGAGVRGGELVVEPPASLSPDQNHERPVPVQANWSAWQDLHLQPFRLEQNASSLGYTRSLWTVTSAHGRICTGTVRVLSAPSLHWTTWAKWCRVRDFHPQPLRSERDASSIGLTRR